MIKGINIFKVSAIITFIFFVKFSVFSNLNLDLLIGFVFGILPFYYFIKKEGHRLPMTTIIILICVLVAYPISIAMNSFTSGYFTLPMVISSFGIAYVFKSDERLYKLVKIVLILVLVNFLFQVIFLGQTGNEVYVGSRNRKSVIFLGIAIFFIILNPHKRQNIIVAFFVLVSSILSVGSAGIIASIFLFLFTFFESFKYYNKFVITAIISSFIFGVTYLYFTVLNNIPDDEILFKLSYERLFSEDIRYEIWAEYYKTYMKGWHLVFGAPFDFQLSANFQGNYVDFNNLHSSYFTLHAKTGLLSIVILLAILWRFKKIFSVKPYYAGLLFIILFRSYSDTSFILEGSLNFAFFIFFLPNSLLFKDI